MNKIWKNNKFNFRKSYIFRNKNFNNKLKI